MRKINKIQVLFNNNEQSLATHQKLIELLLLKKFEITEKDPDLVIAIGGDGSCLRSIKANKFNSNSIFVGVNTGSLGFLQEVKLSDLDCFVDLIDSGGYTVEEIGIQETEIETKKEKLHFYSLNEIVIREQNLNTVILEIRVNGAKLEKYIGDGILIATSIGSTAYNLSFGGSIVYNTLHTLQITPIAPLNNKAYRNLLNSIIVPENTEIDINPIKGNLLISVDGDNLILNDVMSIKTYVKDKRIRFLRLKNYNFYEKLNDKFLS